MDIFIHFQIFILSITYVTHPILGTGDFCKQPLAPTCFLMDSSTFPPPLTLPHVCVLTFLTF